jgi:hypothetical protein
MKRKRNVRVLFLVPMVVLVGIAMLVFAGCSNKPPEGPKVVAPEDVVLPMDQITPLRERIIQTITEIDKRCRESGITNQQLWDAFYSTDWKDRTVDRFSNMPDSIRELMNSLRSDVKQHNRLIEIAFDAAEGYVTPEELP